MGFHFTYVLGLGTQGGTEKQSTGQMYISVTIKPHCFQLSIVLNQLFFLLLQVFMLQLRSSSNASWICPPIHLLFPDNIYSWWLISMESGWYVIPEALDYCKPQEAKDKLLLLKERLLLIYKLNPCYLAEKPGLLVPQLMQHVVFFLITLLI